MWSPEQTKKATFFGMERYSLHLHYASCGDFGRGRVNFLHYSQYRAMTWIYAENNVNNIKVFSVFLGSAHTEPSLFLLFIPSHKGGDWDCMRIWEGTQL